MHVLLIIIMINNIYENNKSSNTNAAAFKATLSTVKTIAENGHNRANTAVTANNFNNNNKNINRGGGGNVQTSYGHGIWYSEIIDGANNANINAIVVHKQQNINNASGNNANNHNNTNNNNNNDNIVNRNVWLTTSSSDASKEQHKQQQKQKQQPLGTHANNECDIIIVDIEDDDADFNDGNNNNNNEVTQPIQQKYHYPLHQSKYSLPAKLFMHANIKLPQKHPTNCDGERARNNITCSANNNDPHFTNDGHVKNVDTIACNQNGEGQEEDEDDSLASMETLSDNVSIWIDGEKHWVAGVDANTTCSELIWALLNYQNGQPAASQRQTIGGQTTTTFALDTAPVATTNGESTIASAVLNKTNSNQYENRELHNSQQQKHLPKLYDKNVLEFNLRMCTNEGSSNMCTGNQPNIENTAKTNNNYPNTNTNSTTTTTKPITPSINQSMPINTKENCKLTQNSTLAATTEMAATMAPLYASAPSPSSSSLSATPIISSLAPVSDMTPPTPPPPPLTLLPLALPPGIATVAQLATEYVIVKQYHHCEEYLDGSTKVFDVLPPRNGTNKKECELLLRHLGPAPAVYINNTTPQLSSLISTDKDSGMGSPVGSARSAKFRRRKHKSSQWLAQANTLHPKLSRCSPNERLMKIILAQDETIQRQLSLLREKERQITKIEEEKHRKRERELGKNYLLETYLNGLDEADCEPEIQDAEEIFIDEPFQRTAAVTAATLAPNPRTALTAATAVTLAAAGTITDKMPSTAQALNMMAKHKIKEKEAKREKKKKRQKEKLTKDDEFQVKDFIGKTNRSRDKEKVDKEQQQQHQDSKTISEGNNINNNGNEQEIEMQILWLEKIYTLNKQLQKEEELAAKLHAKVRKHQLKKAQQTQQEAQLEIDKLDNNLALQCGDIRKVEANLMQTNEQLQKKLLILERLSIEYLQEQQEKEAQKDAAKAQNSLTKDADNVFRNDTNTLLTNLEKSLDIQKLSLNNINSKEEVIKIEKIIAKPSIELGAANAELKELKQEANATTQNIAINSIEIGETATLQTTHQRLQNVNSMPKNHCTTTNNQQFLHHNHQQEQAMPRTTSIPSTGQTSHIEERRSNDTVSTSCMFIDKNMLSSLHVQNAKTIKKQMFHTQTTTTATPTPTSVALATATTTSSQLLAPPQPPTISFSIPKRQFQHTSPQYLPMASTFLTSRPQNSHQIQPTNIVIVQQPSTTATSSCSSHFTSITSSALSSAPAPALVPATAPAPTTASLLMSPRPPNSTSPSPSIMAMNTVDISQLGTLV